ncbi:hypothetical protein, partial [Streptomyces atratus]|uniref:hypothetical protein n=1 Tax=Streptomyces atratus TaxID=1893 RepID=UPI0036553491
MPERPTALIAFDDRTAVGALRAAYERKLRVPDARPIPLPVAGAVGRAPQAPPPPPPRRGPRPGG